MSTNTRGRTYIFGPFVVDTGEGTLLREGRPVQLTPKAFETLVALVEQSGRCLGKEELMRRVWPDSFVEENNLSQNISQLRRALQAEGEDAARYIETVPRRGYRFNATVVVQEGASANTVEDGGKVASLRRKRATDGSRQKYSRCETQPMTKTRSSGASPSVW